MPDALLALPADATLAFAGPAEFLAAHTSTPIEQAAAFLADVPPETLLALELAQREARFVPADSLKNS